MQISKQRCRICDAEICAFMSLGYQPVPQPYFLPDEDKGELEKYELKIAVCHSCELLQIANVPDPERLFRGSYPYRTSMSQHIIAHCSSWADELLSYIKDIQNPFVVEIGCNDGTMLVNFARRGIKHLGIEPAKDVAAAAISRGINVLEVFFNFETAQEIKTKYGHADIILAANVIGHIAAVTNAAHGIAQLLSEDGLFIFEAIYLGDLIRGNMFDQVYGEHVYTFSVSSVQKIFGQHGLEIIDLRRLRTQGGSMRYTLAHKGRKNKSAAVSVAFEEEGQLRLSDPKTYELFSTRCYGIRDRLTELLYGLKKQNFRIAGYGASAKGTTLLNWCGIDVETVEFVTDNTPAKQGKLIPGTSIPIVSPQHLHKHRPDFSLLLAWNHFNEIKEREVNYTQAGGRWIRYLPDVHIL